MNVTDLNDEQARRNEAHQTEITDHNWTDTEFHQFLDLSFDMFCISGFDGYFKKLNKAWEENIGFTNDELQAKPFVEFVHPDDRKATIAETEKLKIGIDTIRFENRYLCKDGTYKWLSWNAKQVAEEKLIYSTARDITEQKLAEAALLKERDWAQKYLDIAGIMMVALDADQKITLINKKGCEILGFKEHEIIGKNWFDNFIPGRIRDKIKTNYENLMFGNIEPVEFYENPVLANSGNEIIIAWHNSVLRDDAGNINGILCSGEDITEHKHANEKASELLNELKTIFNNIPLGIVYLDDKFKFISANKFFCDMVGIDEAKLIGKLCYETVGEYADDSSRKGTDKICSFCMKHECSKVKKATVMERPFGDSITKVTTVPEMDESGNISNFLEIIEDITETRETEEKIREQAALLDKAKDAIAVRDMDNSLVYWNKGAEQLYGWTKEEAVGKNANGLLYKEMSPLLVEAQKIVREKGEWTGELYHTTKNETEIIVESRWTMVYDDMRRQKSILIINTDVTEKKKLEGQLLRTQRLESIGTLANGIAHDINNVLLPITLSLNLLREKYTDDESQKLINILERNAKRGTSLIKQVQSFAQGVEGERIPLHIGHLISEMREIVKETFPKYIEVNTLVSRDLWTISGDATQLHQVLMNLCVNARDSMPDGGILSISAENISIDENSARMNIEASVGQYIIITVSDTGTGITPEIMDKIFEPFFTTKELGKGTGIGLSTVFTVVKNHAGFINVYSEIGKGTEFKVYLPAINTTEKQRSEEQIELHRGNGEWILVVEDETSISAITRSILEIHGYTVLKANDGAEAVAIYTQNIDKIKLVLMDMIMPVMDGATSIRALRKINPSVKIIAVSGLNENYKLANNASKVQAFLSKPYTAEKLLKNIHDVLKEK